MVSEEEKGYKERRVCFSVIDFVETKNSGPLRAMVVCAQCLFFLTCLERLTALRDDSFAFVSQLQGTRTIE